VHERLDVEALSGHDVGDFFVAQLLQDGGFAGWVERGLGVVVGFGSLFWLFWVLCVSWDGVIVE